MASIPFDFYSCKRQFVLVENTFRINYDRGMGMNAVGAYIGELRSRQGVTQPVLAAHLEVSDRIVRDWEQGKHEPKIGAMTALLEFLHGSWEDVSLLMRGETSIEEARQLARARLSTPVLTDEEQQFFAKLNPSQKELVARLIEEMRR